MPGNQFCVAGGVMREPQPRPIGWGLSHVFDDDQRSSISDVMTGQHADISVVIPSVDRRELALDTVRSVLAQSVPVREIILVCNGDDRHAAYWEAQAGGLLRVIRERVPGQQAPRNAGIEAATSTWVALLDDDDLYLPNFVEAALPAMTDGRADVVSTDHRKFRQDRLDASTNFEAAPARYWSGIRPRGPAGGWSFVGKFPLPLLLKRIPIYPSTMVIRRDFALRIGGFDRRMHGIRSEDIEFLIRALTYGELSLVWQPLVHYRVHEGNLTRDRSARVIGRWRVFEFARLNHPDLPEDFRRALDRDLPKRRHAMAKLAYAVGDTALLDEVRKEFDLLYRAPGAHLLYEWLAHLARRTGVAESVLRTMRRSYR